MCVGVVVGLGVRVWVRERVGVQVRKKRQYQFHEHVRQQGHDAVLRGTDHKTGETPLGFSVLVYGFGTTSCGTPTMKLLLVKLVYLVPKAYTLNAKPETLNPIPYSLHLKP